MRFLSKGPPFRSPLDSPLQDAGQRRRAYAPRKPSAIHCAGVGKALAPTPLATTLMEGGGQLPWLPPEEIHGYGFSMILYPTTVLFRLTWAMERALAGLKAGRPMAQ